MYYLPKVIINCNYYSILYAVAKLKIFCDASNATQFLKITQENNHS